MRRLASELQRTASHCPYDAFGGHLEQPAQSCKLRELRPSRRRPPPDPQMYANSICRLARGQAASPPAGDCMKASMCSKNCWRARSGRSSTTAGGPPATMRGSHPRGRSRWGHRNGGNDSVAVAARGTGEASTAACANSPFSGASCASPGFMYGKCHYGRIVLVASRPGAMPCVRLPCCGCSG